METHICRHCGKEFAFRAGKPGFINECPECLHEKTRPVIAADFAERYIALFPERKDAFNNVRRQIKDLGLDEIAVFEALAAKLRKSGTQI